MALTVKYSLESSHGRSHHAMCWCEPLQSVVCCGGAPPLSVVQQLWESDDEGEHHRRTDVELPVTPVLLLLPLQELAKGAHSAQRAAERHENFGKDVCSSSRSQSLTLPPSDSTHPTPRGSETPEKPKGDTIEDVKKLCDELERRLERLVRHSSAAAREAGAHCTSSSVASTARPSVVSPHISSSSSNHTNEDRTNKLETVELHAAAAAPPPSALEATPIGRPPSAARTFLFVRDPTSLRSLSKAQKRIFRFASGSEEGRAASRASRFYFEPTADKTLPYHDLQ